MVKIKNIVYTLIIILIIVSYCANMIFSKSGFDYHEGRMLTTVIGITFISIVALGFYIWFKIQEKKYLLNDKTNNKDNDK
ncbi:hypothetical protein Gferi_10360 [Geosporobacter ferrireducens]|uniref:Uncharacterized protein n=1 Tax=Geosporobacter ferrireducens TaxID=1424294 RepID=A0A1D8GGB2_9FIRM|nr:hypothetical protein Gferi_10360 [Geosporobacter ferrireducens]